MLGQRPHEFVPGNLAANARLRADLIGSQEHEKRDQARENDFKNGRAHGWGCEAGMIHDGSIVLTENSRFSLNRFGERSKASAPPAAQRFPGSVDGGPLIQTYH